MIIAVVHFSWPFLCDSSRLISLWTVTIEEDKPARLIG